MLPPPIFSPEVATMSYPGQPGRVDEYIDAADPRWAGLQSVKNSPSAFRFAKAVLFCFC
jgi:hypothetical protein